MPRKHKKGLPPKEKAVSTFHSSASPGLFVLGDGEAFFEGFFTEDQFSLIIAFRTSNFAFAIAAAELDVNTTDLDSLLGIKLSA
jgi:hypothetical protein